MNLMWTILLVLVFACALLVLAAFLLQRQFLYFPDPQRSTAEQVRAVGLQFWPGPGDDFRGFVAEQGAARGTVVVFHGNAGAAWQRDNYLDMLLPSGYRVVLAEYPGYGGRPGKPGEAEFVADAQATLRLVHEQFGDPVVLWGESLGSGVAAAVAAQPAAPVAGVVLVTPWASLPELAQELYPFLPMRWLLLDRYDSVANLREFRGPVAVVVAGADEIIPPRHGLRLYEALADPKRLWIVEGAGHNDWMARTDRELWRETIDFAGGG
jgi:hypothetical protein